MDLADTVEGLDATYALFEMLYGPQTINYMTNVIEYAPHLDPHWDPYSAVFNVSSISDSRF